ncbi:hypothetical protein IKG20_03185 [Candidatus Saccharibacteria bacterium]|nr:hypothetical protein [Candidatus Saccharibacteria bacterium]
MLNRAGHRTRKGDTLIEVMFAVGIFGLAAIGTVSLMNRGLASSQNTLEVTMARQEIDAQAEALRFLQSAYISEPKKAEETPIEDVCKTPVSYRDLWKCLVTNYVYASDSNNPGMNSVTYEDRDFYTRTTELGQHCDDLFRTNDANAFSLPSKSFVLNPRKLDISDLDSSKKEDVAKLASQLKGVIVNNTVNDKPITLASTFPRLIYDDNNGNLSTLSDASVDSSSKALVFGDTQKNLYSSEGIWVTGVTSPSGVRCSGDDEGAIRPDYYDFHIQTCWDSMASDSASTIGSTVRLFNPDQVSLTSKKTTIDFVNTEWKTHRSSTTSKVDNCSNSSGNHSDINAGGADNKTLSLVGYTCDEANEGVYTDIDANGNYTVQFTIKANKFSTHPGGYFIAKLGPLEVAIYSGGNFQELGDANNGNGKLRPINVYGIIEDSRPVQELPDIGSNGGNYFVEGNDLSYIHEDKDGIKGYGYYNPGSKVRKAIPLFLVSDNYDFPETIVATLTKNGNTYTATIGGYESESVTFENSQSSNLQIGFWMMHYSHNCSTRYDVEAKVDISVNTAKSEDGGCYRVAANTADEGINLPTDDTNPVGNDPTPEPEPTPEPSEDETELTTSEAYGDIITYLVQLGNNSSCYSGANCIKINTGASRDLFEDVLGFIGDNHYIDGTPIVSGTQFKYSALFPKFITSCVEGTTPEGYHSITCDSEDTASSFIIYSTDTTVNNFHALVCGGGSGCINSIVNKDNPIFGPVKRSEATGSGKNWIIAKVRHPANSSSLYFTPINILTDNDPSSFLGQ